MSENKSNHDNEHKRWSRRQFLTTGTFASLGGLMLGSTPLSAFASSPLSFALNNADSDRILVLIYLSGGNDGLNTVIPYSIDAGVDFYKENRPVLKQEHGNHYNDNNLLSNFGDTNFALNQNMEPLMDFWNNDNMHVVHKVGYPEMNLSHFISQQHWWSGTDVKADPKYKNGWVGRGLEELYPSFLQAPPEVPLAMNIGRGTPDTFVNTNGNSMSLSISDPVRFRNQALQGQTYGVDGFEDTIHNDQNIFVRRLINNSLGFSKVILDAYNSSENTETVSYSNNSSLAQNLQLVARLIKGGLDTKVYSISYGSFDTHSSQAAKHASELGIVASAITDFHNDLSKTGQDERVVSFPYSEFGRTLKENGGPSDAGTDHGTVSDLMLFGKGINGGFSGTPIDFEGEDVAATNGYRASFESQEGSIDFRSIYATLLQDWLCIKDVIVDFALGDSYPRLQGLIKDPCTTDNELHPDVLLGHNILKDQGNAISIRYAIKTPGQVIIEILSTSGSVLTTVVSDHHTPGSYNKTLPSSSFHLAAGKYLYRMKFAGKEYSRKLAIK